MDEEHQPGPQMKNNNSVYTVTPPDLKLNTIGPSVLLLGVSLDNSKSFVDIYERLFPEVELTFYVSESGFSQENAPWFRAVTGMASIIFVNLDNITAEEVFLAMQAEHDNRAMVFWLAQEKIYPAMISLLNSYQYQVFNSLEEIESFLIAEYRKIS